MPNPDDRLSLHRRHLSGSALLVTLPLVAVLAVIAYTLVVVSEGYRASSRSLPQEITAKYVAQSGLHIALAALNIFEDVTEVQGNLDSLDSAIFHNSNGNWEPLGDKQQVPRGKGIPRKVRLQLALKVFKNKDRPLQQRPPKDYKVALYPFGNGYIAYSSSFEGRLLTLQGYIEKQPVLNRFGLIAAQELTCLWGSIDAYDSRKGNYDKDNRVAKAIVGGNGKITLAETVTVHGDLALGNRSECTTSPNVTGNIVMEKGASTLDPVDKSWLNEYPLQELVIQQHNKTTSFAQDAHYEKVVLAGTLAIEGETNLYCHGDFITTATSCIKLGKNARLNLYVGGNIIIQGKLDLPDHNSSRFQIWSVANDQEIVPSAENRQSLQGWSLRIEPQNEFVGTIYAPSANLYFRSAYHFFGSMVGYRVYIDKPVSMSPKFTRSDNQAYFHYDLALQDDANKKYVYFLKFVRKAK